MASKDPLGKFAVKKAAESDARMAKINPKGRKLDKNGNPIVTKEELKKSGMSLRDFLNKERGLTRRKDSGPSSSAIKQGETRKRAAADKADTQDRVMNQETRKRVNAPETPFEAKKRTDSAKPARMSKEDFGKAMRAKPAAKAEAPVMSKKAEEKPAPKRNTAFGGALQDAAIARRKAARDKSTAMSTADKGFKSGGMAKARGNGCAVKGKTRGRMI